MPNNHKCTCKKGALSCGCCPRCIQMSKGHLCSSVDTTKARKRKVINYNEDSSDSESDVKMNTIVVGDPSSQRDEVPVAKKRKTKKVAAFRNAFKAVYGEESREYRYINSIRMKRNNESVNKYLADDKISIVPQLRKLFLAVCASFLGKSATENDAKVIWSKVAAENMDASNVDKAMSCAVSIYRSLPVRSTECRVALSILQGLKNPEIQHVSNFAQVKLLTGGKKGPSKGTLTQGHWRRKAFDDYIHMLNGQCLHDNRHTRVSYNEDVVKEAVDFMLAPQMVQQINCKARKIKLHNSKHIAIPSLIRIYNKEETWNQYYNHKQGENAPTKTALHAIAIERKEQSERGEQRTRVTPANMMSRTRFIDILDVITVRQRKQRDCVDDFEYQHGYKLLDRMNEMIDWLYEFPSDNGRDIWRTDARQQLSGVDEYLKKNFEKHVGIDDTCKFHSVKFALGFNTNSRIDICNDGCEKAFLLLETLKSKADEMSIVVSNNEDENALDDLRQRCLPEAAQSFILYMGHKFRAVIQRKACMDILNALDGESAILIMDFKMKIEPENHVESQGFFYGKAGTYCHGIAIVSRNRQHPSQTQEMKDARESSSSSYLQEFKSGLYNVHYLIQLVEETVNGKQNAAMLTYSCIEAALKFIKSKNELKHVTKVTLQSDNARNYNNNFLVSMIPIISKKTGVRVQTFIHNEPGQGKTLLDSFFGVMTWRYKQRLKVIGTDLTLVEGIAQATSGLRNTSVQILSYDKGLYENPLLDVYHRITNCINVDHITKYHEWYYEYNGNDVTTTGYKYSGSDLKNVTANKLQIKLSTYIPWNDLYRNQNHVPTAMHTNNYSSNFDGHIFKLSNFYSTNASNDERISTADSELIAKHQCKWCKHFYVYVKKHEKTCERKHNSGVVEEKKKANMHDFAVQYAVEQIQKHWNVLADNSTRVVVNFTNSNTNNIYTNMVKHGWASSPDRRSSGDDVKRFIEEKANEYYDEMKKLPFHKCVGFLHESKNSYGLPRWMPIHYPSSNVVNSRLKTYVDVYNKVGIILPRDMDEDALKDALKDAGKSTNGNINQLRKLYIENVASEELKMIIEIEKLNDNNKKLIEYFMKYCDTSMSERKVKLIHNLKDRLLRYFVGEELERRKADDISLEEIQSNEDALEEAVDITYENAVENEEYE